MTEDIVDDLTQILDAVSAAATIRSVANFELSLAVLENSHKPARHGRSDASILTTRVLAILDSEIEALCERAGRLISVMTDDDLAEALGRSHCSLMIIDFYRDQVTSPLPVPIAEEVDRVSQVIAERKVAAS